ncbi:MFS transporter [Listeria sp. FSL L7-1485]|uniref:MFS transporter n=1 Tax=Listeria immobilis TaxID=2713502 RepID=A0A7X1C7N6_9LIST|nr:MFS transporter [Listeria immobilis]MBC1483623.1 MFS transporter [Listeria immobilis]MBC1487427.1 MFS transporter [Listeria immobilis]MBC1506733.1 MFS transporter [Listeria immobilis]MBC1509748.1 MFS transporter [Listeria immobilis]MBC1515495.1 MFS transporter [Listeria immobilis]
MEDAKKRRRFTLLYLCMYMAFSFSMTQFTPFLSKIGYDEMERGILLSSYAITTILLQIAIGFFADKFQTIKKFMFLFIIIFLVTTCVFYLTDTPLLGIHLTLIAFSGGLINTCTGLTDTWVLKSSYSVQMSFPYIKAFGSIGWAIGSVLLSFLLSTNGYFGLSIGIFLLSLLTLFFIFRLSDIEKEPSLNHKKLQAADFKALIADKNYDLLILILFLLYSVIIANNITVIDKMLTLGASDIQIGYKWSVQSIFEIPAYFFGQKIMKHFSNYTLLRITAITLTTQFVLFTLASNVWAIILISCLQFLTTPILMIASKQLILQNFSAKLQSTAQLFALSIFTGVSSLIIPVIAGTLTKYTSVNMSLLLLSILPVIAFLLLRIYEKKQRAEKLAIC